MGDRNRDLGIGRFAAGVRLWGLGLLTLALGSAWAQREMENLTRALIAVKSGEDAYLSWRLFGNEPHDLAFNVYQGTKLLNAAPLAGATVFIHKGGAATLAGANAGAASAMTVRPVLNGQEGAASEPARVLSQAYWPVPLQSPGANYSANDASVGDVDGDGEYEIIVKWDPSNSRDNSEDGITDVVYLDAYSLGGKRLWRINLGRNIRAGAHYTQFMVYDFDGDGKAEVICRTSDGTADATGKVIGNATLDHRNASGYILKGPEFLTVFEGLTGKALYSTDYVPARGDPCGWGDPNCETYANRVDRFLAGVAYLDGVHPSAIFCRGYYTRTVVVAWDWDGKQLKQRWAFDSKNAGNAEFVGQGNHQLSVADVDGDGKDEIIYGAMAVDHDGRGLWNTKLGHGDALHVGDFDPARPGLEVFDIHEGGKQPGADLRSAKTGEVYWKTANEDVGRGVAADISADFPGAEFWGPSGGTRDVTGKAIAVKYASTNFLAWWDGDLLRELVDANRIQKASGATLLEATGCAANNGTKSTPSLTADLFGDWREEVMWRTTDSKELRIFTTTVPTTHRLYTLMHNPAYRLAVAWQNVAYNQPPHVDYFLGEGMTLPPPKPAITVKQVSTSLRDRARAGRGPIRHGSAHEATAGAAWRAQPAWGRILRHAGGRIINLPISFQNPKTGVVVRDAFGHVMVRQYPREGQLGANRELPAGLYFLEAQ